MRCRSRGYVEMQEREGCLECSRGSHPFISSKYICCRSTNHPPHDIPFQIVSAFHRRFPNTFTPGLVTGLSAALAAPSKSYLSSLSSEQREKEDTNRITRQRPVLRICAELALVGIIKDGPKRSGGEWIMRVVRDLVSIYTLYAP